MSLTTSSRSTHARSTPTTPRVRPAGTDEALAVEFVVVVKVVVVVVDDVVDVDVVVPSSGRGSDSRSDASAGCVSSEAAIFEKLSYFGCVLVYFKQFIQYLLILS